MSYIAHIDKSYKIHDLEDHLQSVANLTSKYLPDNLKKMGYVAGIWHDLGKYRPNFQGYISVVSGYDTTQYYDPANKSHSSAGMFLAKELLYSSYKDMASVSAIQYVIGCHHTGLLDGISSEGSSIHSRLTNPKYQLEYTEVKGRYNPAFNITLDPSEKILPFTLTKDYTALSYSMAVRMMFSAMVDADFTDTALFMNKYRKKHTEYPFKTISELNDDIAKYMDVKTKDSIPSPINTIRASVLKDCMDASIKPENVFTLSVPTGGGKTLSSMAFALNYAKTFNKDRIIVSIPFTSIIEQNAKVYKDIFGEGNVLEHHSNIDVDDQHMFNPHLKLAAENWNAPIIVTTNVQLFESLFANRTSKCRKVHNIQNSVIILDEAQTIPMELLEPTLAYLRILVEEYNVTIVFCTATQPEIKSGRKLSGKTYSGFDTPYEIIKDVDSLYASLNRVKIHLPSKELDTWEDIADRISSHKFALAVFSTRSDAQNVYDMVCLKTDIDVIHLSATMCPSHRTNKLNEVRYNLANGIPVILISTQVVEAGVDLDFPVVYRAIAGLDSIAQAAGRCNREGKMEYGEVFLLNTESKLHPSMKKPISLTRGVFRDKWFDIDNPIGPKNIAMFFGRRVLEESMDTHGIMNYLSAVPNKAAGIIDVKFQSAANAYKIIKEEDNNTIIVIYDNEEELSKLDLTSEESIEHWMIYALQKYSVVCRDKVVNRLLMSGSIVEVPGLHKTYVMVDKHAYSHTKGILVDETF